MSDKHFPLAVGQSVIIKSTGERATIAASNEYAPGNTSRALLLDGRWFEIEALSPCAPAINHNTRLSDLQARGAFEVGDVDLYDWIDYLERSASVYAKDLATDEDPSATTWKDIAGHLKTARELMLRADRECRNA